MLILLITCAVLIFLLCVILAALSKKDIAHFKLSFSWPLKLNVELRKTKVTKNEAQKK